MKIIKRQYNLWIKGSYTVEAAFVVPVILGIIFALMYVLFFEHDKLMAYSNVRQGILNCAMNEEDLPKQHQWREQMQSNLWMGNVTEGNVTQNAQEIQGYVKVSLQLSIPVLQMFLEEDQEIYCEETWNTCHPSETVRWQEKDK